MGWTILTLLLACAAFAGGYALSGEIWDAMYAAAIPIVVFVCGLLIRVTKPPVTRKQRVFIAATSLILLCSAGAHWSLMHSMTTWQHDQLYRIRVRIEYGSMMSQLYHVAAPSFAGFHQQEGDERLSLREVFLQFNPQFNPDTHVVLTDTLNDGLRIYASSYTDSSVILTSVSGRTSGGEASFRNFDGRTGLLQTRVLLTPGGMDYEVQN